MDRNKSNDRMTAGVIAATMLIATVALLALAGLTGSICAANDEDARGSEGEIAGAAVSAASVTTSINYQGRLADSSGSLLTGTYRITFRLYNVSTKGTALDTDKHLVDVTDGLFNTGIDFDQRYFDGSELWLGVTVKPDSEMTPRQELRPVPYALSLVPGARIISSGYPALHAESTHTSGRGIRGYATATSGTNYGVVGASKSPAGYGGYFYNNGGGTGVYGSGGKYGGYFTTDRDGTSGNHNAGVNVTTTYRRSDAVRAYTYSHSSHGVCVDTSGGGSHGVFVDTSGENSDGVRVDTSGENSDGVRVDTSGENSDGVIGYSEKRFGVCGASGSQDYAGVYAKGKGDGADLILGGSDGKIQSDPTDFHSNIYLLANGNIRIYLDNDGTGEDADFEIYDKDDDCIFHVDESGDVSYGGPNIAAFPRPAYDSGWVSISKDTTKTLTHNLGGNPDKYVVDMQFYESSLGRHQLDYGGEYRTALSVRGAYWHGLDGAQIKVRRCKHDPAVEKIRVRIWVYK